MSDDDHTRTEDRDDPSTDVTSDVDKTDPAEAPEHEITETPKRPVTDRTTAPQSPYSGRQAGIGFVVMLIGVAVVFGVPLLL